MAQTAATLPGTAANLGSGVDWNDTNGILDDGSNNAYRSSSGVSKELTGTNFGFSIPGNATIKGIVFALRIYDTAGTESDDNTVRLKKTSGAVGDNKADTTNYTGTFVVRTYGTSTDLWGTTWTPAEINSSDFGVFLKTNKPSASGDIFVDYFKITVHYTLPTSGALFFALY